MLVATLGIRYSRRPLAPEHAPVANARTGAVGFIGAVDIISSCCLILRLVVSIGVF